jgi:transketolase
MTVLCPGDPWEVRGALRAALKHDGPVFIRIGKKGEPSIHTQVPVFNIGESLVLRPGKDVCLLSTGNVLPLALETADVLAKKNISTEVVSFHTVKPLDEERLADAFARFSVVATVEEHSSLGGLGGSVAEWVSDRPVPRARLCRFGTSDIFLHEAGEQDHARAVFGLTSEKMSERIVRHLSERKA